MTVTRRVQESFCTLLTVKAAYPLLTLVEDERTGAIRATEDAAERFNDCYARAAEGFMENGLRVYGEKTREEFFALAPYERHQFLRKELVCRTVALARTSEGEQDMAKTMVAVGVQVTYGNRQNRIVLHVDEKKHLWSFPKGILLEKMAKTKKN